MNKIKWSLFFIVLVFFGIGAAYGQSAYCLPPTVTSTSGSDYVNICQSNVTKKISFSHVISSLNLGSGTVTSVGSGYGLLGGAITTSGILRVDTSGVATHYYVNSRGFGSGTVMSVGSGFGLTGGAITSSGTLKVDTTNVATHYYVNSRGFGSGTVTSFSSGNLSPLFTTSVGTATTTPALSFTLSNAAAHTIFGNFSGSSGAPSYNTVGMGVDTWISTPSSANLATALTDETGSGALVFATSPSLVTPVLGTPTSGTLTNCTGYTDAHLSLSDITTNNVSISAHGFAPKAPNDATKFLRGDATWNVPANIYNSDGSLSGNRVVTFNSHQLTFDVGTNVFYGASSSGMGWNFNGSGGSIEMFGSTDDGITAASGVTIIGDYNGNNQSTKITVDDPDGLISMVTDGSNDFQINGGMVGWQNAQDLNLSANSAVVLKARSDGVLEAPNIHNNAAAQGDAIHEEIRSGTYTFTTIVTTNVSGYADANCQWMRVGNVVTVSGGVEQVKATSGNTATEIQLQDLPIPTSNGKNYEIAGSGSFQDVDDAPAIHSVAVYSCHSGFVCLEFAPRGTSGNDIYFTFTYVVE